MDGYDYLAGFLLLFVFFIYITWFGFSVKVENQKEQSEKISINPYDQVPFHRKLIDKKNSKVGMFDLGNHILIIGLILIVIFVFSDSILAILANSLLLSSVKAGILIMMDSPLFIGLKPKSPAIANAVTISGEPTNA